MALTLKLSPIVMLSYLVAASHCRLPTGFSELCIWIDCLRSGAQKVPLPSHPLCHTSLKPLYYREAHMCQLCCAKACIGYLCCAAW